MTSKRNVEGLRNNAQKKRGEAFQKTDEAIQYLLKNGRNITFNAVAATAGVSKAWLYKEPEIKDRIQHLREQVQKQKAPQPQRASDASKDVIIKTLKERIRRAETDNRSLRQQLEVVYGKVLEAESLSERVEHLEKENGRLREQLEECRGAKAEKSEFANKAIPAPLKKTERTTHRLPCDGSPVSSQYSVEKEIQSALADLGIKVNSTLAQAIQQASHESVLEAIESLKEAISHNRAKNPRGFLLKAIQDRWLPNENYEQQVKLDTFNKWWKLAYPLGLVKAATQIEGVQHILTAQDEWLPFSELLKQHPIDSF